MNANVGTVDRTLRVLAGCGLLAFFFLNRSGAHWFGLIGIVPLLTATVSWCPAYRVFGINTCSGKKT